MWYIKRQWSVSFMEFVLIGAFLSVWSSVVYGTIETDKDPCYMHARSFYPYLVKINDMEKTGHESVAHGSVITRKAVLTLCSGIDSGRVSAYRVVRHGRHYNDPNVVDNFDVCYAAHTVSAISPHPKCTLSAGLPMNYFNFGVLSTDDDFQADNDSVPVIEYPYSPLEVQELIQVVNLVHVPQLELPHFNTSVKFEINVPTPNEVLVQSVQFLSDCVPKFCADSDGTKTYKCETEMKARTNYTILCFERPGLQKFKPDEEWSKGAPLAYGGAVLGLFTELKTM